MKRLALAAVVLLVTALTASSEPKGELKVGIPWTPENLDPTVNLASIRAAVGASMFDSLVGRDAGGKIVPELAESWRLIDDNTWQFKRRKGVVFHTGEPFNAEAVRFTVQRVLNPEQKSPNRANIKSVLDGNGKRTEGPITANMFGYDPSVRGYTYAPAKAQKLLADAGYPDGVDITLESPAGRYQGDKEVAEAIAGQWQKAGIRPKVQIAEWGAYFKRYLGKQSQDAYLLGLGGPMQDGDELYNLYYKNEKVDELFDLGRSTMDPAKRRKIYSDLARTMIEDATWVYLMQQVDIYGARDRLTWTPRADQWIDFHQASVR